MPAVQRTLSTPGDQQRMSTNDDRLPINANPIVVHEPLRCNQGGQADSYFFARDTMQNGTAEAAVYNSKKLEDAVHEMGLKIKQHEENIKFLKAEKNGLDNSILDMQVALGKYQRTSESGSENEELYGNEEETIEHILKHEKSAAAIWCQLKTRHGAQASHLPWMKDVLGVVAMLGNVDDDNLSRLLSDYLGHETMLAIVCKTSDGVKALETYDKEGHINKILGLHELGASIGRPLDGRFLVICLEKLRPYSDHFIADDPQRRLDLLEPTLPNGESPPGFLGFAVNMVNIDSVNLYCATKTGYGLRETLFYNLFSRLHVYKTREDMLHALPCIRHGAISLDGGMIKHNGVFSLGKREMDVKFPKSSGRSNLPQNYFEMEREMKEMKWKKERAIEDMQREQALLDRARFNFDIKKQEYLKFLAQSSSYATQPSFRQEESA